MQIDFYQQSTLCVNVLDRSEYILKSVSRLILPFAFWNSNAQTLDLSEWWLFLHDTLLAERAGSLFWISWSEQSQSRLEDAKVNFEESQTTECKATATACNSLQQWYNRLIRPPTFEALRRVMPFGLLSHSLRRGELRLSGRIRFLANRVDFHRLSTCLFTQQRGSVSHPFHTLASALVTAFDDGDQIVVHQEAWNGWSDWSVEPPAMKMILVDVSNIRFIEILPMQSVFSKCLRPKKALTISFWCIWTFWCKDNRFVKGNFLRSDPMQTAGTDWWLLGQGEPSAHVKGFASFSPSQDFQSFVWFGLELDTSTGCRY